LDSHLAHKGRKDEKGHYKMYCRNWLERNLTGCRSAFVILFMNKEHRARPCKGVAGFRIPCCLGTQNLQIGASHGPAAVSSLFSIHFRTYWT
jgi:hypothetical protein